MGNSSSKNDVNAKLDQFVANEEEKQTIRTSTGVPPPLPPSAAQLLNDAANSAAASSGAVQEGTDVFKDGRYRVARPETIKLLQAQQASPEQQAQHIMYNQMDNKDLRQFIKEQEGLEIGNQRKKMLAQQWRFFLASEPIQRGIDAGILLGCVSAAVCAYKPKNRVPLRIAVYWLGGFCGGMLSIPLMVMAAEAKNDARIKSQEREMFAQQRQQFYDEQKAR